MKNKLIILVFVGVVLLIATLGVVQSNEAIEKAEKIENTTSTKVLDSIISKKIDYRFTSFDNTFMYNNLVVIDDNNVIIGRLILYTSEKEIDSFYNSNLDWRKTRLFTNLKNGTLRILPKIEE